MRFLLRGRGTLLTYGAIVGALATMSIIAALSYLSISALERNTIAVARTQSYLVALEETVSALKDVVLARRGHIITANSLYRSALDASVMQAKLHLEELTTLAADAGANARPLADAASALLSGVATWTRPADAMAGTAAVGQGQAQMNRVLAAYRRIKAHEEVDLVTSRAAALKNADRASTVLAVGGTLSLMTLLLSFAALLAQISRRTRAERELAFLHDTILAIGDAADMRAALGLLLDRVRGLTGWSYGQTWLPDAGGEHMTMALASPADGGPFATFKRANDGLRCAPGQGLIGAAWQSGRYEWRSTDAPTGGSFRRSLILETGFRSWMAFPITTGNRVLAIVEFFDVGLRTQDDRMMRGISILARQIGPSMERRQAHEKINLLHADLTQYANRLDVANKELESFTYSVSHDLRAPLRAIDGYSRMLQEDCAAALDAEGSRLLDVVRDNARQMGQLIDDLLAFSRLGRKAVVKRNVDMTKLATDAYAAVCDGGGGPKIELGVLPSAHGDGALLRQVWTNLMSNAAKYSSKRPDARIEVSGSDLPAETIFCVKDNGVGFDMNYYHKLFGVFQRLHSAEEFPGTGVGLAIVQRVVSRHGGRVWAQSRPGEGATFYFTLPKEKPHVHDAG